MEESFITAVALLVDMATLITILVEESFIMVVLLVDMATLIMDTIILTIPERHINEFGIVTVWADAGMNITRKNIFVRG